MNRYQPRISLASAVRVCQEKYIAARDGKPCGKMVFDAIVKGIPYDQWEYKTELMKHLRKNDPQRWYEIVDEERRNDPWHTVGE